jgi:hypothetical protein
MLWALLAHQQEAHNSQLLFYATVHSLVMGKQGLKGGYTLVTLPRTVTPYRDSVDGTRDHVTYQKLGMR